MKILILAQHFSPEDISGAVLATELASGLAESGHQVTFVTCVPNYPYGIPYPGYKNRILSMEIIQNVKVIRVWSYISPKKNFKRRLLNYLSFSIMAIFGSLLAGKQDVLLCYSPPFSLGFTGLVIHRLLNIPWVFRVEDLYPESAVAAGYIHHPTIIRLLGWFEKVFYRQADHVSLLTESFRNNLLKKGVPEHKLSVIPVWADADLIYPLPRDNNLRKELDLDGQFVVLYSGNMGQTSDLVGVLHAANRLRTYPQIEFLFVGEGIKKPELQKLKDEMDLSNVHFYPYFPRERYAELLGLSNLCLVTLNPSSADYSLPGKTFNILASGRPILAIAPETCELSRLVQDSGCGIVVPPENVSNLANIILDINQRLDLDEMGKLGRRKLEEEYSRKIITRKFEAVLLSVMAKNG